MITSPDQYLYIKGAEPDDEHPHGDLDRILLTGKIMPTIPESEQPFRIKGEDIAFLLEASKERAFTREDLDDERKDTFTRTRDHVRITGIIDDVSRLFKPDSVTVSLSDGYIRKDESWPNVVHSANWDIVNPYSGQSQCADSFIRTSEMKSRPDAFYHMALCDAREIMRIFDDIAAAEKYCLQKYLSDCTPSLMVMTLADLNRYWTTAGTVPQGGGRNPSNSIYTEQLTGSWANDGTAEHPDMRLRLDEHSKRTLNNFEMSFEDRRLAYFSGKAGEMEMWAMFSMLDEDMSRPSGKQGLYSYALVKLGTIPAGALRDGAFHFPSGYMTTLIQQLLSNASADVDYSGDFPPFVSRDADAYRPEKYGRSFSHWLQVRPEQFFLHAMIRERTRWESPEN